MPGEGVQRAGGVIQAKNIGARQMRAGQVDALALAAGQRHATVTECGVQSMGKAFPAHPRRRPGASSAQRRHHWLRARLAQVGGEGIGKQEALLWHHLVRGGAVSPGRASARPASPRGRSRASPPRGPRPASRGNRLASRLLPAPVEPTKATTSPGSRVKLQLRRTATPPPGAWTVTCSKRTPKGRGDRA